MTCILSYLLIGFALHFVAVQILHAETSNSWQWEFAAIVFWPIAAVCGIILARRDLKERGATALSPANQSSAEAIENKGPSQ